MGVVLSPKRNRDVGATAAAPRGRTIGPPQIVLGLLALIVLAIKLRLDGTLNLNWDEFHYLSRVFSHQRGDLSSRFQTLHVYFFFWLPWVGGNEVDQLLRARSFMYGVRVGACVCIYLIGRHLLGATAALFAVVASCSFSFVVQYGENFRSDPLVSFGFLLASYLLIVRAGSRAALLASGVVLGFCALISIKAVLFMPSIAILLLLRFFAERPSLKRFREFAFFGVVLSATALLLYLLQVATLAPRGAADDLTYVSQAATTAFTSGFFIRKKYLMQSLGYDWAFWSLLAAGFLLVLVDLVRQSGVKRRNSIALIALALPVLTISIYRNAYPYYYVTIIPPASLLLGVLVSKIERGWRGHPIAVTAVVAVLVAPIFYTCVHFYRLNHKDQINDQRRLIDAVHEVFPEPVPYIDRAGMISSFPSAGMFMSSWTMSRYRANRRPIMAAILRERRPECLISNVYSLDLRRSWTPGWHSLLPEDYEVLKNSFIRHWDHLWVPGKQIVLTRERWKEEIHILIDGLYTLSSTRGAIIDGRWHTNGDVVYLAPGPHMISLPELVRDERIELRWGDHLHWPRSAAPALKGVFRGFKYRR